MERGVRLKESLIAELSRKAGETSESFTNLKSNIQVKNLASSLKALHVLIYHENLFLFSFSYLLQHFLDGWMML